MKKQNKKYLCDYTGDMITALFYSYIKNLPSSALREIERIYEDETGKSLNTNFTCGKCNLTLLQKTGKLYFSNYPEELPEDLIQRFNSL